MNTAWARVQLAGIGFLCLALAAPVWSSSSLEWPGYAVRIVSMHPPGSVDDPVSRPLALELKNFSKFQVALQHHLLDASPSGPEVIASSNPNGQTVGVLGETAAAQGLRPLALLAMSPLVVATHPSESFQGFQDVIRAAKRAPGQVLIGSPGPQSAGQLAIEEFNALQGVALTAITYKASGPLIADLVSGRMALGVMSLSVALPHAKAGRIRVIGISSKERDARLPDVRPLAAQGLEGFELHSWWGAFGAQKISEDTANQITHRLRGIARDKKLAESMRARGIDLVGQDSASLERVVNGDASRWAALKQQSGPDKKE
jgi:tripartite-type tricarboxylate transporter receptor subunit TctC